MSPDLIDAAEAKQSLPVDHLPYPRITDTGLIALAQACPRLRHLDFNSQSQISDAGLLALAAHCPSLQYFHISYANAITDHGLLALLRHCPYLHYISAYTCDNVSVRGVWQHIEAEQIGKRLMSLSLSDNGDRFTPPEPAWARYWTQRDVLPRACRIRRWYRWDSSEEAINDNKWNDC
eukprot:TRINITY_DN3945_c0_g2_i3.p1 TRINITY_DN3945_c0_g2~~TRINITY_DN3945_c0_g2_i3.p1  ORF type:complete len:204 (-),score=36.58 TRINITY_DN3945_c0_g2_i3:27-560(-)